MELISNTLLLCLAGLTVTSTPCAAQTAYRLYRANLHAHTGFSDGGLSNVSYPSEKDPGTAAAYARQFTDLNVSSTSDHGEQLSPAEWVQTVGLSQQATVPGEFVDLWGFEWTATTDTSFVYGAIGVGHIGVYGSDLRSGASDWPPGAGNLQPAETTPTLWWKASGAGVTTAGSLYQWILDHGQSAAGGGTIVCQFNHPSLYPRAALANPSPAYAASLSNEWFRKLEYVPQLDPYFDLMELGSRTLDTGFSPGYQNGDTNEPYFQLALDNGWHVAPTNNEDNHADHFGHLVTYTRANAATSGILTTTGIWAEPTTGLSAPAAQKVLLAALRARRTYAVEDKAGTHGAALSIRWVFNTPSGVKWMGARGLSAADVSSNRCHLEFTRTAGLRLNRVEVVTNRGVVARQLPVSGVGVQISGDTASWDFSLPAEAPAAQIRSFSATAPASPVFSSPPLPPAVGAIPLTMVLDPSPSGRIERYYYVRCRQTDGTLAYSAPVWLARTPRAVLSYMWIFGDGSPSKVVIPAKLSPGSYPGVTHTYSASGTFYPRVVVNYSGGAQDIAIGRVVTDGSSRPFYGDVNGDGQINAEDVQLLARLAAGLAAVSSPAQFQRADVAPRSTGTGLSPGDGRLGMSDVLCVARFLARRQD